jgi:hypothetical protein
MFGTRSENQCAALAVLLPGALGCIQFADAALGAGLDPFQERRRHVLARQLDQFGLVVEQVERARRAVHVQPDDRLDLGREVRLLGCQRVGQFGGVAACSRPPPGSRPVRAPALRPRPDLSRKSRREWILMVLSFVFMA